MCLPVWHSVASQACGEQWMICQQMSTVINSHWRESMWGRLARDFETVEDSRSNFTETQLEVHGAEEDELAGAMAAICCYGIAMASTAGVKQLERNLNNFEWTPNVHWVSHGEAPLSYSPVTTLCITLRTATSPFAREHHMVLSGKISCSYHSFNMFQYVSMFFRCYNQVRCWFQEVKLAAQIAAELRNKSQGAFGKNPWEHTWNIDERYLEHLTKFLGKFWE